jgi:hypothetical protein
MTSDQLNVGRQHNNRFRIPVQESCVGAEYWVGDNSTRLGGQENSRSDVLGQKPTTGDRRQFSEDDV